VQAEGGAPVKQIPARDKARASVSYRSPASGFQPPVGLCLEGVAALKQHPVWEFPGVKLAYGEVKGGAVC